jgi:opacity protein-like surface antigen
MKLLGRAFGWTVITLMVSLGSNAQADDKAELQALKEKLAALEAKIEAQEKKSDEQTATLATEIKQTRIGQLIPEKAELKSQWGLGPAASGVYNVSSGLSIGGYGEANFRSFVDDAQGKKNTADLLRLITYFGYKFNDNIVFNSEIEYEHATTEEIGGTSGEDGGEVEVEFAYLDFLVQQEFNVRAGSVLIPMGFINEIHEPPYFFGVMRPEVERLIIPTTWNEIGAGFFGQGDVAGKLEYRTYLVNGLRASRFEDSGIREGRQLSNRALMEDVAWTGRVDYSPNVVPGLMVGGSFWVGNSGQNEDFAGSTPNVRTMIGEAHAQYRYRQLSLRALGSWTGVDDADILSQASGETIAERMNGWYVEAGYDILPHLVSGTRQSLSPFVRFESLDTQASVPSGFTRNASMDKQIYTIGLSYKPIDKVVVKADYRNFQTDGQTPTADEVAVGVGFVY